MDRRLVGVVVLVLALAAVMVVPSLAGRRVAGAAVSTVLPDPPQVGDCLLTPIARSSASTGWPMEMPYLPTAFGSCTGPIAGEVVAVWKSEAEAAYSSRSRLGGPCYRQAADYAGLVLTGRSTLVPGGPVDGVVSWKPTIGFVPYQIVPSQVEKNAGRGWVACLAVPTGQSTYRGSLRDAYTSGSMADVYGLCWSGTDLDSNPSLLPCDEPHAAELMATGWIRDRSVMSWPNLQASCDDLASAIMHTDDASRGGALTVVVDPVRMDGQSRPDAPLSVNCFVASAGPQLLTGTVIGLGAAPVPFEQ